MNIAVIGAQYGDEGKGKIVDYLAEQADFALRFNGSGNAGHCVEEDDGTRYKVHIIPSAVFREGVICCTGAGMVINPFTLKKEISRIRKVSKNPIWIDPKAHVVTSFHILHDKSNEEALGDNKIGTTLTGNGPAYADKASRRGIRLEDLISNPDTISAKLKRSNSFVAEKKDDAEELHHVGIDLSLHFVDVATELNRAIMNGKNILFAGAHGTFLDIDHGDYPFVTSSTCTVGGIGSAGVSPTHIDAVVGVVKAYTTRSGSGPLPEMDEHLAKYIQRIAKEYGTTTGRKRRIGWIDLQMVNHASILNNFTYIAITMLDVLSGFEEIKLFSLEGLETIKGWKQDISSVRSYEDLPIEAMRFIRLIERAAGVPASLLSVGPKRSQIIFRR